MVTINLDKIFNPKSIAIIGGSDEESTVGYALMKNLIDLGYKGKVYPVNLHKDEILGLKACKSVSELPETVDLAVIATPAKTVPDVVEQCGKAGIIGIIIISAGFKEIGAEGKALEEKIVELKRKYNLRIIKQLLRHHSPKHQPKRHLRKQDAQTRQHSLHLTERCIGHGDS